MVTEGQQVASEANPLNPGYLILGASNRFLIEESRDHRFHIITIKL
jgi:hypothetical protein